MAHKEKVISLLKAEILSLEQEEYTLRKSNESGLQISYKINAITDFISRLENLILIIEGK